MEGMERGKRDGCGREEERGASLNNAEFHGFSSMITPCSFAVFDFSILARATQSSRRVARV